MAVPKCWCFPTTLICPVTFYCTNGVKLPLSRIDAETYFPLTQFSWSKVNPIKVQFFKTLLNRTRFKSLNPTTDIGSTLIRRTQLVERLRSSTGSSLNSFTRYQKSIILFDASICKIFGSWENREPWLLVNVMKTFVPWCITKWKIEPLHLSKIPLLRIIVKLLA